MKYPKRTPNLYAKAFIDSFGLFRSSNVSDERLFTSWKMVVRAAKIKARHNVRILSADGHGSGGKE